MAQAIVLFCDPHLVEDNEEVVAKTITWAGRQCELCQECLSNYVIADLDALVEKYGRRAEDMKPKPRARRPSEASPAAADPAYNDDTDLRCPHGCNKGRPYVSLQGKRMHMTIKHKDDR